MCKWSSRVEMNSHILIYPLNTCYLTLYKQLSAYTNKCAHISIQCWELRGSMSKWQDDGSGGVHRRDFFLCGDFPLLWSRLRLLLLLLWCLLLALPRCLLLPLLRCLWDGRTWTSGISSSFSRSAREERKHFKVHSFQQLQTVSTKYYMVSMIKSCRI